MVTMEQEQPDDEMVRGQRSWARLMTDDELRAERHDILWLMRASAAEDEADRPAPEVAESSRLLRLAQLAAIERELVWRSKKGLAHQAPEIGFSRAVLDEIKARLPLAGEIEKAIELRRTGRSWVGRCPFHDDRSPSLVVWPDNHFRCFGCGVHGDLITWTQAYRRIDFRTAVAELARQAGVEV